MPQITIKMYEGRTDEQKNEIVDVLQRSCRGSLTGSLNLSASGLTKFR